MEGGTLVFVGGDDLAQPFHLFGAVVVIVGDAGILDVGIGFVLAGPNDAKLYFAFRQGPQSIRSTLASFNVAIVSVKTEGNKLDVKVIEEDGKTSFHKTYMQR